MLAVYETNESDITNISANKDVILKEHHIYGSSRLGIEQKRLQGSFNQTLQNGTITSNKQVQTQQDINVAGNPSIYTVETSGNLVLKAGNSIILKPGFSSKLGSNFLATIEPFSITPEEPGVFARTVGDKRYELSNHLGNVLSVVSDRKLVADPLNFTNFTADVLTFNDYYPFGMLLPNRHKDTDKYRYGFQGQEMDDEIKGEGNSLNYTFRMHDPRVGRFFAPDPLEPKSPWYTPYQFSGNRPIDKVELEGLESAEPPTQTGQHESAPYNHTQGARKRSPASGWFGIVDENGVGTWHTKGEYEKLMAPLAMEYASQSGNGLGGSWQEASSYYSMEKVQQPPTGDLKERLGKMNFTKEALDNLFVQGTRIFNSANLQILAKASGSIVEDNSIALALMPIPKIGKSLGVAKNSVKLSDDLASTFMGGKYESFVLESDLIMYRAGDDIMDLGQFFSADAPISVIQARIDKAILPVWPGGAKSVVTHGYIVKIPKGTTVHKGLVAPQGGYYLGGTEQILIETPWLIEGVEVLGKYKLK